MRAAYSSLARCSRRASLLLACSARVISVERVLAALLLPASGASGQQVGLGLASALVC
jgi:hypothetical protein